MWLITNLKRRISQPEPDVNRCAIRDQRVDLAGTAKVFSRGLFHERRHRHPAALAAEITGLTSKSSRPTPGWFCGCVGKLCQITMQTRAVFPSFAIVRRCWPPNGAWNNSEENDRQRPGEGCHCLLKGIRLGWAVGHLALSRALLNKRIMTNQTKLRIRLCLARPTRRHGRRQKMCNYIQRWPWRCWRMRWRLRVGFGYCSG